LCIFSIFAKPYQICNYFFLHCGPNDETLGASCLKLGQLPTFGAQAPARLVTLIGPDKEIFLQGGRAENRGIGIGAFAYYQRSS
jgi:hypothetical protein